MATKYISPTGSNSNEGTYASPWLTPAYAYTNTTAGDTIILLAGTYTLLNAATYGSRIWQGYTSDPSLYILDGAAATISIGVGGATFRSVTIRNAVATSPLLSLSSTLTLDRVIISGISGGYLIGSNGTVTLTNCLLVNLAPTTGIFWDWSGSWILTVVGINCVIHVTSACLLNNAMGTRSLTFTNSIFYGPITFEATYDILNYCCKYGTSGSPSGAGTISVDPLFVDIANGNFRLQRTSPCIGAGVLV